MYYFTNEWPENTVPLIDGDNYAIGLFDNVEETVEDCSYHDLSEPEFISGDDYDLDAELLDY